MLRRVLFIVLSACALLSCEKKEDALVLPAASGADHDQVGIGADYGRQVYYSFSTNQAAGMSTLSSWDVAFEATVEGRYVFLNGGRNVLTYNTHGYSMTQLTALPAALTSTKWQFDMPTGNEDSTAIGKWWNADGNSKGEIFIVSTNDTMTWKMRILSADASRYVLEWARLGATKTDTAILQKDARYNFVCFSFAAGKAVQPEPPKADWDVVFTRYRYVYRHYNPDGSDFPYLVNGVLLNPFSTSGATDHSVAFADMDAQKAASLSFIPDRDVIGFDWKSYPIGSSGGTYTVDKGKNYVVRNQSGDLFKLHFLDWNAGSALFEFLRLK